MSDFGDYENVYNGMYKLGAFKSRFFALFNHLVSITLYRLNTSICYPLILSKFYFYKNLRAFEPHTKGQYVVDYQPHKPVLHNVLADSFIRHVQGIAAMQQPMVEQLHGGCCIACLTKNLTLQTID
ncbi:MAG: hypothetical protein V4649_10205 [Bacteroidota bacterium]